MWPGWPCWGKSARRWRSSWPIRWRAAMRQWCAAAGRRCKMPTSSDRHTFRALVADVVARAKAILFQAVNGRVEKAVALVLQGDVEPPAADGSITVYSATDPTRRYVLIGHGCTCQDFERGQAPEGWCCHRI